MSERIGDAATTRAMALNVAAWTDASVVGLGVETQRSASLWWRKPGGSPIYLAAVITDPEATDEVLHADLGQVARAWGGEPISLWDCWGERDLRAVGFERRWRSSWYLRHPSPLPDCAMPEGLSIETVRDAERLAELEQASWEGFETPEAARELGRFGQHAPGTLEDPAMRYLLARRGGRAAASAIAHVSGDIVGIYGVSTLPRQRRRGYATALVRAAVALRPDLPVSVQPDPPTVRIYTDMGFVPAGPIAAWHSRPRPA